MTDDPAKKPFVGQIVTVANRRYVVTSVTPKLTPYHRAGQLTRVEGYTLGLRAKRWSDPEVY